MRDINILYSVWFSVVPMVPYYYWWLANPRTVPVVTVVSIYFNKYLGLVRC